MGVAPNVAGRVETGHLSVGNKILIQPLGEIATVRGNTNLGIYFCVTFLYKRVHFFTALTIDDCSEMTVYAGSYANVVLANVDLENINVGNVLCDVENPIPVTTHFEARIVIFNIVLPITIGYTVSS